LPRSCWLLISFASESRCSYASCCCCAALGPASTAVCTLKMDGGRRIWLHRMYLSFSQTPYNAISSLFLLPLVSQPQTFFKATTLCRSACRLRRRSASPTAKSSTHDLTRFISRSQQPTNNATGPPPLPSPSRNHVSHSPLTFFVPHFAFDAIPPH